MEEEEREGWAAGPRLRASRSRAKYEPWVQTPMAEIEVVHTSEMKKSDFTSGIIRDKAFETPGLLFARSRIKGGNISGWHHHGKRETFAFVLHGQLHFEWVDGEKGSADVKAGDFFRIPIGLIHRDVNPNPNEEAVIINLFLGEGPTTVNVPPP